MHFFSNVIVTFMFLSRLEYTFGPLKTVICYFLTGIAGNIFSIVVQRQRNAISAGASTSLFGVIGLILGYLIINWKGLDLVGPAMKCQIYCIAFFIIIFIIIFTPSAATDSGGVDYYGHLGGFLAGVWLSCIHNTIINTNR